MKIEVLPEQLEAIVLEDLKDTLETVRKDTSTHPDDVADKAELIPALEIVIRYYGVQR